MKVIEPKVEVLDTLSDAQLIAIERAGRTCYKSKQGFTGESARAFIRMIIKRGHESVLEHEKVSVRFTVDRGVSHEIVRHRIAAYSQECVVGSTLLGKNRTIKELYERSLTPIGKIHNRMTTLRSCDINGVAVPNYVEHVFYKGRAEVYRLRSELGYEIVTTANHEFLRSDASFSRLCDLAVGDELMVNGRPCLLKLDSEQLEDVYLRGGMSVTEIADVNHVPYRTVLEYLKRIGIFQKHLNDKDPGKYNRCHSSESVDKMKSTILRQYREEGRTPWNKGLSEIDSESVSVQGDALRKFHHDNESGKRNSNWKNGISSYRKAIAPGACQVCGATAGMEVHHIDRDRTNNAVENLVRVCVNCHRKLHHGWHVGRVAHVDRVASVEYIGVDDVYDLEMAAPWHNYVANGFIVHNSTRYCNYSKEKFGRELTLIKPPFWADDDHAMTTWRGAMLDAEESYLALIDGGARPEEARSVLPNSLKTEIVVTYDLREWRHFFRLRTAAAAHPQMRQVAVPLLYAFQTLPTGPYDAVFEDLTPHHDPELPLAEVTINGWAVTVGGDGGGWVPVAGA